MKLKQITIKEFKSIKNPINIILDDEHSFFAFIGKNGCGKTNVLQAIKQALGKKSFYDRERENYAAEYLFELTDEELEKYFPAVDIIDHEMKRVSVCCSGSEPEVKYITAPAMEVSFHDYKQELQSILSDLKKAIKNYWEQLRIFEKEEYKEYVNDIETLQEGDLPSDLSMWSLKQTYNNMQEQLERMERFFAEFYKDDTFKIDQHSQPPSAFYLHLPKISFYKISEVRKLELSPMIIKALDLTDEKVKQANKKIQNTIKRINKKLETAYNAIQECLQRFESIKNEIVQIYSDKEDAYWTRQNELDELRKSFINHIKDECYRATYYIDNENTLLFERNTEYHMRDKSAYFNSNNPVNQAFDNFLNENGYYLDEESILQPSKIPENRLKKLASILNEQFLQRFVPTFDKGEILGFELRSDKNGLELFVKEKSGSIIPFNQTSLGRRWYLTYIFVKQLLKEGDCLFIDEPAAFLHPQAQEEIRDDLIALSQKGIYVFVATHSAYMLPEKWNQIYNVTMEENGTHVQSFSNGDDVCGTIQDELGIKTVSDILFNLSKTILLVEGIADKVCIEKFADLLGYSLRDRYIHICDGDSILQVAHICHSNGIKYQAVLDNDNQYKPKSYKRSHSQYKDIISKLKQSPNCIFIGEGENGALEDYFKEEKNAYSHYDDQKKWKIAPRLIKKAKTKGTFHNTTLDNFEQLFIKLGLSKLDKSEKI